MIALDAGGIDAFLAQPGTQLIEFWAPWCGPCRMLEPALRRVADEGAGRVAVAKVDISTQTGLAERFGVRTTPTLMLFRDGQAVGTRTGALPGAALVDWALGGSG